MRLFTKTLLAAGAAAVSLSMPGGLFAAAQPRIYVSNGASGTIAEYDLTSRSLVESSAPISPWGAAGNAVVLSDASAIIMPENVFHKLRPGRGVIGLNTFGTFPPTSGPLASNGEDSFYAIDSKWNSVDEYVSHPKARHHSERYSGGGIGRRGGLPTHMAANATDLWVTANNATVTHFANDTVQSYAFPAGTVFADAYVDAAGAAWVLFQSPEPTYFANETSCSPVGSGPVTRYAIGAKFVNDAPPAILYGQAGQNPVVAHLAVDAGGRAYASASHVILDFDPGTFCPDDSLTIGLEEKAVLAPLATYGGNLIVADPVANAIEAYAGGTTTRLWRFTQPTGQTGPVSVFVQ